MSLCTIPVVVAVWMLGFGADSTRTPRTQRAWNTRSNWNMNLLNNLITKIQNLWGGWESLELNHLDLELNIDWDIGLKGWIVHLILKSVPQTSKGIWRWGRVGQMGTLDRGEQGHASLTLSCVYLAYREWGTDEGAIRMDKSTYQLPRLGITGQSHCWDWSDWIIVDVVVVMSLL